MEAVEVLTIGHSTHPWERFVALLQGAKVNAVADVRTSPYSGHTPHFNRDKLHDELRREGISYVFLGKELGGRPDERTFYCEGIADYEKTPEVGRRHFGVRRHRRRFGYV